MPSSIDSTGRRSGVNSNETRTRKPNADRPGKPATATDDQLEIYARLADDGRDAALRALAGRLAHQLRNPLSAVRAACSGLRAEIEDAEQRETLELSLHEIDRMLGFVTATVKSLPASTEPKVDVDVGVETADVVAILRDAHPQAGPIVLGDIEEASCHLPRNELRATLHNLIMQLAATREVTKLQLGVSCDDGMARVSLEVTADAIGDSGLSTGMTTPSGWLQPTGLLVAERFVRDVGGRLSRSEAGTSGIRFILEIPCDV
jgi:C4-dicarboxylate-specific signal transduction histidine kinase